MLNNYPFKLPLCTGPSNVFSSLPFRNMYSFKIWRPWIAVLAVLAGVVQWRYKDWNRPQIPWHFTGYSQTLLEFSLAYLNPTNSVPKTIISTCIFTVDQLMWRTIVHHIPRWREQSPLRDFMRLLWPFTLWIVDCMHVNWQIRCIWIVGHVVVWEIMRIQWFWGSWNNRQDVVDDSAGCGGRHEM